MTYTDPRVKNIAFDHSAMSSFVDGYTKALSACLSGVDAKLLAQAVEAVETCAAQGGTVYFTGNGGSAAICDHLVCDFIKGTFHEAHPPVQAISLTENVALYTAAANDKSFEDVFAFQLEMRMKPHDVLIAVSSSGNSENILRAVAAAKKIGAKTIGLSGFAGGGLKTESDIPLFLEMDNYGVVEDGHSALLHMMVQIIANKRDGR